MNLLFSSNTGFKTARRHSMSKAEVQGKKEPAAGGKEKIVVMNPMGHPPSIEQLEMATRPASLDGKTVYLVDVRFNEGDLLLQQMQQWFSEHMPTVNTVFKRKSGVYTEDDPGLFEEIRNKGDAVIMAVGH
jgi:hypothetical protein